MTIQKSITKEEVRELPLGKYTGEIIYVDSEDRLAAAFSELKSAPWIGIDTETKPNFKKGSFNPVALLQMATEQSVFLIPLKANGMPPMISEIMSSTAHTKVGISTAQDMKELKRDYGTESKNVVDLNKMATRRGYKNIGARNLAGMILGIRISKSKQMSDWEKVPLLDSQKVYAATDAWLCLEIYKIFQAGESEQE